MERRDFWKGMLAAPALSGAVFSCAWSCRPSQTSSQRRISPKAMYRLQAYPYPGNVRELQNIIREAVVLSDNDVLDDFLADNIGTAEKVVGREFKNLTSLPYPIRLQDKIQHLEKEILSDACIRFGSTRKIAQNLGTSQSSVMRRMKKYGLA